MSMTRLIVGVLGLFGLIGIALFAIGNLDLSMVDTTATELSQKGILRGLKIFFLGIFCLEQT